MKKQPELVSKWVLLDGADLPRTEAWLEKMAAQGLLFQSSSALRFGWWFFLPLVRFTFRRDTPRTGRRYRLCPTREPDTSPSGELLELYRHGGWQYTAALTADWGAFYIFYTDDPNAEEPYTDLDSFRLALRHPREGILALLALRAVFLPHARRVSHCSPAPSGRPAPGCLRLSRSGLSLHPLPPAHWA